MPRKKKTDDTPIVSNVDLSMDDDEFEAEKAIEESSKNTDDSDEIPVNASESDDSKDKQKAPKKRRSRKTAEEIIREEAQQHSEDNESAQSTEEDFSESEPNPFSDDFLNEIDNNDEDVDIDVFPELYEDISDINIAEAEETPAKEKSALELAQQLKAMREKRDNTSPDNISAYTNPVDLGTQPNSSLSTGELRGSKGVAKYFGISGNNIDSDVAEDSMIWSELRRYLYSGIPIFCRIVGSVMYRGEISAICKPINDKYKKIFLYVPFSELDIPNDVERIESVKRFLIEQNLINIVVRVCVIKLYEENQCGQGSIRLGNLRARKDAYFRGVEDRININSQKRQRLIIGKGTVVRAYVENVNRNAILVNIYGARSWISRNELSYEYIDHPSKLFKIGQSIKVKILSLETDERNNYNVTISASVKALYKNETIKALKKWAFRGHEYTATIAVLPNQVSNTPYPMAFADLGFNCVVGAALCSSPYTVGSKVVIKIRSINNTYAFGDIIRVLQYSPKVYS